MTPLPQLLTTDEVAEVLRVTPETVRRRVSAGLIPALRPGGHRLVFRRADIEALLADAEVTPAGAR